MYQEHTPTIKASYKWLNWENASKCAVLLWLIAQVLLIFLFWDTPQKSDQGAYLKLAQTCFDKGQWYPNIDHEYSSYIWAPGLINFFILQLKIFGTLKINFFLNLLMNIGIAYNIWVLCNKWFNKRTAQIAITFFCIIYSNIMVVLPAGTEVPFVFLAISALNLCLTNKFRHLLLAGTLLAIANWIRPLIIIFLPALLLCLYKNNSRIGHYVALIAPIILLSTCIGFATKNRMGYFNFQSSTSGINLIMTANDKAYGGVATSLMNDTTNICHIKNAKNFTYAEKDSIWKTRAFEWIKKHPTKFAKLYIFKIAGLYIEDSWAERPILGGDGFVDKAAHGKADKTAIIKRVWNMFSKSLVYYVVIFLFFISLLKEKKGIFTNKGYLLLIIILGTLSTCLFSVSPRYHYPMMFAIIIWAAYGLDKLITAKKNKTSC